MSSTRMKSRRLRKRLVWNLFFLSAVFTVLIALNTMDYWQPMLSHESSCSSREAGISGPDEFLFKHLILRFGDAPSSHVSLVTMGDVEGADLLADVCSGRRFTADILDALNRQHATVIALDKVYGPNSCKDAAANTALVTAAERSQAKLVAGQGTHHPASSAAHGCLVKSPSFGWGTAKVSLGITNTNQDDLKIPLRWPVYASDEDSEKGDAPPSADGDTFALKAALAADREITTSRMIQSNLDANAHPYGDFRGNIPVISAKQLLCSDAAGAAAYAKWNGHCEKMSPVNLHGRVVVVASESDTDVHPYLDGEIGGGLLEAHYIEALLSGRYYSEVPFWISFILFFSWVALTEGFLNLPNLGEIPKSRRLYKILVLYVVIAVATIFGLQFFDFVPPVSFLVAAATVLSFDLAADAIARNKKSVYES